MISSQFNTQVPEQPYNSSRDTTAATVLVAETFTVGLCLICMITYTHTTAAEEAQPAQHVSQCGHGTIAAMQTELLCRTNDTTLLGECTWHLYSI